MLITHLLPSIMEELPPRPASLLLLLALLPLPGLTDEDLCNPLLCSSLSHHPCQLALDMCFLYDKGLLSLCLLTGRHQVDAKVSRELREAVLSGTERSPDGHVGHGSNTEHGNWIADLR